MIFCCWKIPLNKKPWRHRWDRRQLFGVIYPPSKRYEYEANKKSETDNQPYVKWDMMKHYRESINDDDHHEIVQDIQKYESEAVKKEEIIIASKKLVKARRLPTEPATTAQIQLNNKLYWKDETKIMRDWQYIYSNVIKNDPTGVGAFKHTYFYDVLSSNAKRAII